VNLRKGLLRVWCVLSVALAVISAYKAINEYGPSDPAPGDFLSVQGSDGPAWWGIADGWEEQLCLADVAYVGKKDDLMNSQIRSWKTIAELKALKNTDEFINCIVQAPLKRKEARISGVAKTIGIYWLIPSTGLIAVGIIFLWVISGFAAADTPIASPTAGYPQVVLPSTEMKRGFRLSDKILNGFRVAGMVMMICWMITGVLHGIFGPWINPSSNPVFEIIGGWLQVGIAYWLFRYLQRRHVSATGQNVQAPPTAGK
jgi:hypothetical protein